MDETGSDKPSRPTTRFPFDSDFDFSFRPDSYWPDIPGDEAIVGRIKGTARRDIATRALDGEQLERLGDDELYRETMEFVLDDKLPEEARDSWGRIHPMLMGGEYLPDYDNGEVAIARIELRSTTGDVIEVRAQRDGDEILYRVIDEYPEDFAYEVNPARTREPLSLGELIELIDTAENLGIADEYNVGLADSPREMNYAYGGDPHELVDFVTVSSLFYPMLRDYYARRAQHWFEARLEEEESDE
jgi:hypothetical protein